MPDFSFIVNNLGLRGAAIRILSDAEPLEPKNATIEPIAAKGNGSTRLDTGAADSPVYNWLGLPVFCSCRFVDPDDKTNAYEMLTVIIEVNMTKNIDSVAVNGVDGTIKTYINDGDFEVRMRGMITNESPDDYPSEDVEKLVSLLKIRKSLKVVCDYLRIFGIYELAIMGYSFPQLEETQNTQLFDISALSDKPIQLIEKNN